MNYMQRDIYIDTTKKVFVGGETVRGRVELILCEVKRLTGIHLTFNGKAKVYCVVPMQILNCGKETYLNITKYLAGEKNGDPFEMQPGCYSYQFEFDLPSDLPPSYEGKHGYIRYSIKLTLETPCKRNPTTQIPFSVFRELDLNTLPFLLESVISVKTQKFCRFPCSIGHVTCTINIPCSGFVPHQAIPIIVELENKSKVILTRVKALFYQRIYFHANLLRKIKTNIKYQVSEKVAILNKNSKKCRMLLEIPSVPTNLYGCNIIQIKYELIVKVVTQGLHYNIVKRIPVTIGTEPLNI